MITWQAEILTKTTPGFDLTAEPQTVWEGELGKHGVRYRIVAWAYAISERDVHRLAANLHHERLGADAKYVEGWLPLTEADAMKEQDLILAALGDLSLGRTP